MSQDIIALTGATGHIGGGAADLLVAEKLSVRAIARSAARLSALKTKGADTVSADLSDPSSAERALMGATSVFAMIPPNVAAPDVRADQNRIADSLVGAIRKSGIKWVVALSSVGAHRDTGMGPVNGLFDWEKKLRTLTGVNVLMLRPAYFMENLLMNVPLIKANGIMGSALRADLRFPAIATADIAAVVAKALSSRNFSGHVVRELHGQRDITMEEARAAIAGAIGKPTLAYVQFPYADAEKAMMGMGLSADYAGRIIEMSRSMNEGVFRPEHPRSSDTTTPTSIEAFARVFVGALS